MRLTYLLLVPIAALTGVLTLTVLADGTHGPVRFQEHVIEPNIKGGYSVIVADINHDGKPDVIGLTQQSPELAWYENPGWQRHVLIKDQTGLINAAAGDVDAEGIPTIAFQTGF